MSGALLAKKNWLQMLCVVGMEIFISFEWFLAICDVMVDDKHVRGREMCT